MVDDEPRMPIEEAAAKLGVEPKRLRGFIARSGFADPIGDMREIYVCEVERLAQRGTQ